ncbi:cation:proton antiporter [candidate division MSBL1 archaeon SCGC-AAA259D14]|uniref:Cation:proton antiporter n=3 Tax=candidate division MSBL1 TaxID=215777 RepID=A0A133U8A7_9EURY|nr:cation:proton antiporter [candidate division MSBL1 archaeon SCGC-AAA259D14]KXA93381.1 cation:proton antiporter [candidate division MSBL1 archaeon SCGC-AAA259E22]
MKMSIIVRTGTKLISPFLVVYSFYLMIFGHLNPGGGFQAGVMLASGVVLLIIAHGHRWIEESFKPQAVQLLEGISALSIVILAILGLGFGGFFLNFIPGGDFGNLLSGGIVPFFNVLVGLEVGGAFTFLFYILLRWVESD